MIFNSWQFLVFFPVITALYFLLQHRFRWPLLLGASCFFYMSFVPVYILILALTIVVDYSAAIWMEHATGKKRKALLWGSLVTTLLILFVFKYFNFFAWNVNHAARWLHWNYSLNGLSMILPIGLSFHTFQSMSYVIEVYRGRQKAERHFGIYSLYVMFYPQLVAGPIERPQNLLHQFREPKSFDYALVTSGLRLMAVGFFRKVVIADNLSPLVNSVYGRPMDQAPAALLIATIFFAVQIYCDFSGYSAIAIGAARVMGIDLMQNFKRPYLATSIGEFWGRWHISLSTWFKDYVYIPLGGNRVSRLRHGLNLLAVFLVSGIWHGANWTYIIWGGLHGAYLIVEMIVRKPVSKMLRGLRLESEGSIVRALENLYVFLLVGVGWVFFRSSTVTAAWHIVKSLPTGLFQLLRNAAHPSALRDLLGGLGMDAGRFAICIGLIVALWFGEWFQERRDWEQVLLIRPRWQRWAVYYAALILLVFISSLNSGQTFIYFQF